jgi:hypothetical protein
MIKLISVISGYIFLYSPEWLGVAEHTKCHFERSEKS